MNVIEAVRQSVAKMVSATPGMKVLLMDQQTVSAPSAGAQALPCGALCVRTQGKEASG